jgi:hypothetical protein
MNYSMHLLLTMATSIPVSRPAAHPPTDELPLADVVAAAVQDLLQQVEAFRQQPVSPARTQQFEQQLQRQLRELGRQVVQWTYNHLEPADVADLSPHLRFEGSQYTRLTRKTPQQVWTLFGQLRLWRVGYRPTDKTGDPTLFPLTRALGLVAGASPALAERAARWLGQAGMTQQRVLECLQRDHGVGWGVKKLRQVGAAVAAALAEQRQEVQVERLLDWLQQAAAGTGRHKPVLSVGRDGITLRVGCRGGSVFEVATTGTVSVLDRRGRRLGTVYLARTPEPGQQQMSQQLTQLLQEVLRRWQGPLPRLCYVTDAGDSETSYYQRVLRRFRHPRTGERLEWIRVVDYYHASERLWKLAEQLFGQGRRATSWVRKMQRWLKKPGGAQRVLHSAAALRSRQGLRGKRQSEFEKAYRYLRDRLPYLRYADYQRQGLPLGSGVTEAGCKTVYTQRLKLSGMRWQKAGAQQILNLRVLLLSGVWEAAWTGVLANVEEAQVGAYQPRKKKQPEIAA